jgi:hypothetical protein
MEMTKTSDNLNKIKKFILFNISFDTNYILDGLNNNDIIMTEALIKILKIYKLFPSNKNENKFIYGGLIQMTLINALNNIFYSCTNGSNYKYNCKLYCNKLVNFNINIRAKKNRKSNTILINKFGDNATHVLDNLITIICVIEDETIYLIQHSDELNTYVSNTNATIGYKASLLTYINKFRPELIYRFPKNNTIKRFKKNIFPHIKPRNIYTELYNNL